MADNQKLRKILRVEIPFDWFAEYLLPVVLAKCGFPRADARLHRPKGSYFFRGVEISQDGDAEAQLLVVTLEAEDFPEIPEAIWIPRVDVRVLEYLRGAKGDAVGQGQK